MIEGACDVCHMSMFNTTLTPTLMITITYINVSVSCPGVCDS